MLGSKSRLSDSVYTLGGVILCIHYIFDLYYTIEQLISFMNEFDLQLMLYRYMVPNLLLRLLKILETIYELLIFT